MNAYLVAGLVITGLVYLLLGCMAVVSARADRNAPRPTTRDDYREAS